AAITEEQLIGQLSIQLGVQIADLSAYPPSPDAGKLLPQAVALKYRIVPLGLNGQDLYIAMTDPLNFLAIEEAKRSSGKKIVPMIATHADVDKSFSRLYGSVGATMALQDMNRELTGISGTDSGGVGSSSNIEDDPSAAPTVRLVNSILERAITERASDLHFEPQENEMVVRLRIDGSLHALYHIPVSAMNAVVSRLKVMGNMDIAERKIPQDGRANIRIKERNVDLRISTLPTVYGEKLVIRLLDKSVANLGHQGIGLKGTSLERYELLLRNSSGVILISGPTGSGKSSTMYTMIQDLNTEGVNLVTLEDPVEFNTKGVNQCQINEKTGMSFAGGETASIAMRAAITGHLVLSTIHTNDTIATVDRLLDMGVEPFLISTALKGVMAQRLVKRICPRCKEAYHPSHEDCELSGIPYTPELLFYKGRGCPECFNTGYRGRAAVFEILVIDNVVRKLISTRADRDAILAHLNGTSFLSLAAFSRQMVLDGITTVQEASRTIYSTASEE
ncbi:MAG: GspE/PulE family protein, partial [Oscillospiraceae bacterium]